MCPGEYGSDEDEDEVDRGQEQHVSNPAAMLKDLPTAALNDSGKGHADLTASKPEVGAAEDRGLDATDEQVDYSDSD